VRLGLTLLVIAGALAALFVSATRTPSRRTTNRLVIVVNKVPLSCTDPDPAALTECLALSQGLKALEKEIRANESINRRLAIPSGASLVLEPAPKWASSSP
jgi:hypothetical protein